jgi:hypothetical protein
MKLNFIIVGLCAVVLTTSSGPAASNDVLVPGDNLVLDGIPKIPTALVEEVSRYSDFRTAGFSSWHPARR